MVKKYKNFHFHRSMKFDSARDKDRSWRPASYCLHNYQPWESIYNSCRRTMNSGRDDSVTSIWGKNCHSVVEITVPIIIILYAFVISIFRKERNKLTAISITNYLSLRRIINSKFTDEKAVKTQLIRYSIDKLNAHGVLKCCRIGSSTINDLAIVLV